LKEKQGKGTGKGRKIMKKTTFAKMYPRRSTYKGKSERRSLTDKYGDGQYSQIAHRSAVEISDNMKCWWIYTFIMNYKPINWANKKEH